MDARLDYNSSETLQKFVKQFNAAAMTVQGRSGLPVAVQNLVLLRASQINGCAVCVDMHVISGSKGGDYVPGQWG